MGYIKKRGKNYQAFWIDRDGKQQRQSTRTGDRRVAEERLRSFELADTNPSEHGLEDLETTLLHSLTTGARKIKPPTLKSYTVKARQLLRILGPNQKTRLLRRMDIETYIDQRLSEGVVAHTAHKELVVLRRALKHAVERGVYSANIDHVVPRFSADYVPRTRWLSRSEYSALIDGLPERRKLWVALACNTGSRLSETEGLLWSDIDWERRRIHIRGTKTKRSDRVVPMLPELESFLSGTEPRTQFIAGSWANSIRDLGLYCGKAGVERVTSNDLRRTYCSWLFDLGVSAFEAMKLMGHGSTKMVEQVYGQLGQDAYDRVIASAECAEYVHHSVPLVGIRGEKGQKKTAQLRGGNSFYSSGVVPRDRIELPTRGFSVPMSERKAVTLRLLRGGKK